MLQLLLNIVQLMFPGNASRHHAGAVPSYVHAYRGRRHAGPDKAHVSTTRHTADSRGPRQGSSGDTSASRAEPTHRKSGSLL